MMSDATEYALYRLRKGDTKAAEKRLEVLKGTNQVQEFIELSEALSKSGDTLGEDSIS